MLTGLTQTGGSSLGLWGATLLVIVLNTTPAHAAFLMIFVNLAGILGRFTITALIEPLGRRGSGTLFCVMAALLIVAAGYLYDVYIGTWSLFYMLLVAQGFFSSAIYSCVGPYMTEIWPARLRSSGMGMSYGVGNLGGKVFGPLGLALIMGAGDIIKPAAPNLKMLGPGLHLFRLLVRSRHHRLLGVRPRDQGPHVRGDRRDLAAGGPARPIARARAPSPRRRSPAGRTRPGLFWRPEIDSGRQRAGKPRRQLREPRPFFLLQYSWFDSVPRLGEHPRRARARAR